MKATGSHIVILCSRLDVPGGIERAIVNTSHLFIRQGHRVSLVVLDEHKGCFYPLDPAIGVNYYELHFGMTKKGNPILRKLWFLQHLKKLKSILSSLEADLIISTDYAFTIAAFMVHSRSRRLFSWEHHHFHSVRRSTFWQQLFLRYYPKLEGVICLNTEEAFLYQSIGCKTVVIPNFISQGLPASSDPSRKNLLTVGWLSRTKGTDLIPEVAEKVFMAHPDWTWTILGTGEEEKNLKQELEKRNIIQKVRILSPSSPQITELYLSSSIYVLTSRSECFPMVLLEAMSLSLPAVAFDCPTGPRHILTNQRDGILVRAEDPDALAEALIQLMGDESRRRHLGEAAARTVLRFSEENMYRLWKELVFRQ